jgi:hypothetical protein
VAAAIVTAVFAGVTGYVANVVLRNAEASSREVREFFLHPIAVGRFLSAERVVLDMRGPAQQEAQLAIVHGLLRDLAERAEPAEEAAGHTVDVTADGDGPAPVS